jgi:hypothetical protein
MYHVSPSCISPKRCLSLLPTTYAKIQRERSFRSKVVCRSFPRQNHVPLERQLALEEVAYFEVEAEPGQSLGSHIHLVASSDLTTRNIWLSFPVLSRWGGLLARSNSTYQAQQRGDEGSKINIWTRLSCSHRCVDLPLLLCRGRMGDRIYDSNLRRATNERRKSEEGKKKFPREFVVGL